MSITHFLAVDPFDPDCVHFYELFDLPNRKPYCVHTMHVDHLDSFYGADGATIRMAINDGYLSPGELIPISAKFQLSPEYRRRFSREQQAMDAADQAAEDQAAMEQRRAS